MPTLASPINVAFTPETSAILKRKAKEDEALLRLSEKNEAETDRYYSSEEAWGDR